MDKMTKKMLAEHCPNSPWCQEDPEKIAQAVFGLVQDQEPFIKQWSYKWYENMQFVYGNHHLKWSRKFGVAVDTDFMRPTSRAINQRSHTNITKVCAESLGSLLYSNTPEWEAKATNDSCSTSSRWEKISQSLLDAQVKITELHHDLRMAANSFVTYGQIAACVEWDHTTGEVIQIPAYQKGPGQNYRSGLKPEPILGGLLDGVMPALGSDGQPTQSEQWKILHDDDGMPQMRDVHLGRVKISFLTPFEYRRQPGSSGMHNSKYVQRFKLVDFDDWIRDYGEAEGKTKHFSKVIPQNMNQVIAHFATMQFLRLNMISPISDDYWRQSGYSFTEYLRRKIMVIEHYDRPCEDWPQGRKVVVANGHCTHICKPQYRTNKMGGWHPFVEAQWFSILPSNMAVGPLHDVVAKNKQLNTTDSLIATSLLRNFGSHLLVKAGGGLDPAKLSGTPGEIHEVSDPSTVARWLHDQTPIPAAIGAIREETKGDVYEVSGAGDALRGQRTQGVSSGYAYRQAQEREERRLTPARKEFERFVGGIGEKVLSCMKSNCIRLGDDVIGYLKKNSAGKFSIQDAISFISQPLDYGVDISVTEGSMELKSKATTQANLIELNSKTPLGVRLQNDPNVMDKFLKYFGAESLRDRSAAHRDRAQRENEVFADVLAIGPTGKADSLPLVWAQDDHDIHMDAHGEWMIKNDYELGQSPWLMESCLLHIEQHRIQKRELAGEVPPGTTQIVPQMAQYARSNPIRQGVVMEKQAMDQQKAQQVAGTPPGQGQGQGQGQPQPQGQPPAGQAPQQQQGPKAPGGAKQPAPIGSGGPPQTSLGTAAQNTPTGRGQV
jgi:hypothetical protein